MEVNKMEENKYELIENKDLENQIELSCKASKLSEEKLNFVISVIDLLENIVIYSRLVGSYK